jgi:hypothetical protein
MTTQEFYKKFNNIVGMAHTVTSSGRRVGKTHTQRELLKTSPLTQAQIKYLIRFKELLGRFVDATYIRGTKKDCTIYNTLSKILSREFYWTHETDWINKQSGLWAMLKSHKRVGDRLVGDIREPTKDYIKRVNIIKKVINEDLQ